MFQPGRFPVRNIAVTHFNNYTQLSEYMDKLGLFHMDLSLGRMEKFWAARGVPEVPVVHVVGTNGKGSTTAFLSSIARAHGLKVGQFTSPHFISMRERIQVNRAMLSRQQWVEYANEVVSTPGGTELTYFEFQTCLAMIAFEREQVDMAVMEAGLGGRFDATNVFCPELTLYTPIGMDHERILGGTLSSIARDKAGALHPGGCGVTGPQEPDALLELENRADEVGARFMYAIDMAESVRDVHLGLAGIYQATNANLALAGWRWFAAGHGIRSEYEKEVFGLESAFIPGRFQRVVLDGHEIVLDGAHNSHALEALKAALVAADIKPGCVIFTCLEDKELEAMVPLVSGLTKGPVFIPAMKSERARTADEVAKKFGERSIVLPSLEEALSEGSKLHGSTLICGSLYLLAEFYILFPQYLNASRRGVHE